MKKFLLLGLMALCALSFSSCTEFRQSVGAHHYIIKKVDGQVKWGLTSAQDIRIIWSHGDKKYGWFNKSPEELKYNNIIQPIYDSMYYVKIGRSTFFVGLKNNQKYYYDVLHLTCAQNHPVYKTEYIGHSTSLYGKPGDMIKFYTPVGVFLAPIFEPHEDIFLGLYGYAFKDNGKWGYQRMIFNVRFRPKKGQLQPPIPAEYDEILEGYTTRGSQHRVFCRKGNKWVAYNQANQLVSVNPRWIQQLQQQRKIKGNYTPFAFGGFE